jgi:hypothetical protein
MLKQAWSEKYRVGDSISVVEKGLGTDCRAGTWSPLTIGTLHLALYSLLAGSGLEDYSHVPRFVIVKLELVLGRPGMPVPGIRFCVLYPCICDIGIMEAQ